MTTVPEAQTSEIKDRVTRMETRQLQMMEHLGMDTHGRKPKWLAEPTGYGVVDIPSMGCSVKDILAAIPEDYVWTVYVAFKGTIVTELRRTKTTLRRKA